MIDWASYVRSIYGLFPGGNKAAVSGCFRCHSDNQFALSKTVRKLFLINIDW